MPSPLLDALRAAGMTGDVQPLATRLHADGITADDVAQLADLARRRGKNPNGLLAHWIRSGEARDVLASAVAVAAPAPPPPTAGSHASCVAPTNPYGWLRPRTHVAADHDRAGEWNPHRQSFNLTETERIEAGAPDHRVRTCTRHPEADA